jgi:antitoxin (DNA-binding transcriptional repressor) of toxin-antitoxin stability system
MTQVNMHEAKTEVTISRNGRPAVRMTALEKERPKRVFGFAKGRFEFDYEAFQALDAEVQAMFDEGIENDRLRGW